MSSVYPELGDCGGTSVVCWCVLNVCFHVCFHVCFYVCLCLSVLRRKLSINEKFVRWLQLTLPNDTSIPEITAESSKC